MKAIIAALGILAATAGSSFAADFTATLKTPVERQITVIRAETVWRCEKDKCVATVVSQDTDGWRACSLLVGKVGPVSAYGTLDAAALARCNGDKAGK